MVNAEGAIYRHRCNDPLSPRPHFGIMPVIEDQITTPPAGIMPVMQVIEAQRASILVPHDHLHNNQIRASAAREAMSVAAYKSLASARHPVATLATRMPTISGGYVRACPRRGQVFMPGFLHGLGLFGLQDDANPLQQPQQRLDVLIVVGRYYRAVTPR
jgi:hypothetical protein